MKLMDILRKLGIISCQAKATVYTSAKDRPLDLKDDINIEANPSPSQDTSSGQED